MHIVYADLVVGNGHVQCNLKLFVVLISQNAHLCSAY